MLLICRAFCDSKFGGGYFHFLIYDVDVTKHFEPTPFGGWNGASAGNVLMIIYRFHVSCSIFLDRQRLANVVPRCNISLC